MAVPEPALRERLRALAERNLPLENTYFQELQNKVRSIQTQSYVTQRRNKEPVTDALTSLRNRKKQDPLSRFSTGSSKPSNRVSPDLVLSKLERQVEEIETLKNEIGDLKDENSSLRHRVTALGEQLLFQAQGAADAKAALESKCAEQSYRHEKEEQDRELEMILLNLQKSSASSSSERLAQALAEIDLLHQILAHSAGVATRFPDSDDSTTELIRGYSNEIYDDSTTALIEGRFRVPNGVFDKLVKPVTSLRGKFRAAIWAVIFAQRLKNLL